MHIYIHIHTCRDVNGALKEYKVAADKGDTESSWNREFDSPCGH